MIFLPDIDNCSMCVRVFVPKCLGGRRGKKPSHPIQCSIHLYPLCDFIMCFSLIHLISLFLSLSCSLSLPPSPSRPSPLYLSLDCDVPPQENVTILVSQRNPLLQRGERDGWTQRKTEKEGTKRESVRLCERVCERERKKEQIGRASCRERV